MDRGDVYFATVPLPDRTAGGSATIPTEKLVVVLRGGAQGATETDLPVVVASTDKRAYGQLPRNFEVAVGAADGFHHDTLIDCRWVYTFQKSMFPPATYRFTLPAAVMRDVSVALVAGLQMHV